MYEAIVVPNKSKTRQWREEGRFQDICAEKRRGRQKKVGGPDLDTLSALYSPRVLLVVTRVLEAVSAWEKGSRIGKSSVRRCNKQHSFQFGQSRSHPPPPLLGHSIVDTHSQIEKEVGVKGGRRVRLKKAGEDSTKGEVEIPTRARSNSGEKDAT